MEEPVATVNGKTVTVKKWVAILTLVILFISLAGTLFGAVIDPIVWKKQIENTVEENTARVDRIELWQEEHSRAVILQNSLSTKQIHELQLNLKALMQASGLKYQSITE